MASRDKLLIRAWLPRQGCCHLRSPEMTDVEARGLLDAARGAIDKAQESGVPERVPGTTGCAFVMARRSPDPNEGRTAPRFVLISIPDADRFLRDAVADRLRDVEVPETMDAASDGWIFLDLGVQTIEPRNPEGRRIWSRGIMAPPRKSEPRNVADEPRLPRSRRWRMMTAGLVLLAVYAIARLDVNSVRHRPGGDALPTVSPGKSNGDQDADEKTWQGYRETIEGLLRRDWAWRILNQSPDRETEAPKTANEMDDRQILAEFARLLRRPTLGLRGTDDENYKQSRPRDHPFVAFLIRLPEGPPGPPRGDAALSATDALAFLKSLDGVLTTLGVTLDFEGKEALAQRIERALDYNVFYEEWCRKESSASRSCNGPLDRGREDEPYYRWVGEVREVIRVYGPPRQIPESPPTRPKRGQPDGDGPPVRSRHHPPGVSGRAEFEEGRPGHGDDDHGGL